MDAVFLPLLVLAAQTAAYAEECPAYLVSRNRAITLPETRMANRYADCMSKPSLPVSAQLAERLASCAAYRPAKLRKAAKRELAWIDHIASQFPACETRIRVKMK